MARLRDGKRAGVLVLVGGMAVLGARGPALGGSFSSEHFAGSDLCGACHNGLRDKDGRDVGIVKDETGSMMANAFVDPLWRAKVKTEIVRAPQLREVILRKCTSCHAPMANYEASLAGRVPNMFEPGSFTDVKSEAYLRAQEGVSCSLCHRMEETDLGTPKAFSGHYHIRDFQNPEDRVLYGPFQQLTGANLMKAAVTFTPAYGEHIGQAKLCGACHNLFTPFVDAKGSVASADTSEFPEQMAFGEWGASLYGAAAESSASGQVKPCQECHMPPTSGVKISILPENVAARDKFFQHTFQSGNSLVLGMLDANREALGVSGDLRPQLSEVKSYLATAAEVEVPRAALADGTLEATVRVKNKTGHKLPTGIPFRRAFLHVTVTDANGRTVFESGRVKKDRSIEGADADADETKYEPHHEVITSPEQVQIYEGVMGNTDGGVTYTLLRAAKFLKETRLPPAGFDKGKVPAALRPTEDALADANYRDGSDEVIYRVSGLEGKRFTVKAELNYQTASFPFVRDLFKNDSEPEVKTFKKLYKASPVLYDTIASATREVQ